MTSIWSKQKIKGKLLLGIGVILLIFALSSGIVLSFIANLGSTTDRTLKETAPMRALAQLTEKQLIDADDVAAYYVMDRRPASWADYLRRYEGDVSAVKAAIPKLADGAQTSEERTTIEAFSGWLTRYLAATEESFVFKRAGKYDRSFSVFLGFDTAKGIELMESFVGFATAQMQTATTQVEGSSRAAIAAGIVGTVVALFAGAAIALALGSTIARRLNAVTSSLEEVVREDIPSLTSAMARFAAGDLSARVTSSRQPAVVVGEDETALLAGAYNGLVGGVTSFGKELSLTGDVLNGIIGEIKRTVDAAANGDFSTRLQTSGQHGVFKELGDNLNRLMDVVTGVIEGLKGAVDAAADGDFRTRLQTSDQRGVFKDLGDNLNRLMDVVSQAVNEIKLAADVVSVSAREISTGNGDLSQRTEEQAASLEETAASMEQLTATVNQNSENARQANSLAIGASDIALKGGQVVGEVVDTMAAINASGKKIVDIISVIDGIAFQTNILALNAAVEAARAGEQGRGFAVVAGEVRTLAQRSAGAAKEIKALIGDSVEKTAAGTILVDRAGATMADIVASVNRVTDIMAAIAAASNEQSSGIGQVNEAVLQMDKVTQQNAALVEEIAAAAKSLEENAAGLVDVVSVFQVVEDRPRTGDRGRSADNVPLRPKPSAPRIQKRRAATATLAPPPPRLKEDDGDWSSF